MKKMILLVAAVFTITGVYGQRVGTLTTDNAPDTGTNFVVTKNVLGLYYTYKMPLRSLISYLRDSFPTVAPGGSTGQIQVNVGGVFTGYAGLTYTGQIFDVGFSGNNFFDMNYQGGVSFSRNINFGIVDTNSIAVLSINNRTGRYGYGKSAAGLRFNAVSATDTFDATNGYVFPQLGGSGTGIVGVNNAGKLAWTVSPTVYTPAAPITFTGSIIGFDYTLPGTFIGDQTFGNVNVGGALALTSVGSVLNITTGANRILGTATLSSGLVTISNTQVTANSKFIIDYNPGGQSLGGGPVSTRFYVSTITPGVSFVVTAEVVAGTANGTDGSTIWYLMIN